MHFRMKLFHHVHLVTSRETLNGMYLGEVSQLLCLAFPVVLVARRNERRGICGFHNSL